MPDYQVTLTDEQVEGLSEYIKEYAPDEAPTDVGSFIRWWIERLVDSHKKEKLLREVQKLPTNKLKLALEAVTKNLEEVKS